uniref:Uncharacterized protein n=1 Tax=Oryza punctata TaxID=4537 RepID=A0A0E0JKT3_ORYPU
MAERMWASRGALLRQSRMSSADLPCACSSAIILSWKKPSHHPQVQSMHDLVFCVTVGGHRDRTMRGFQRMVGWRRRKASEAPSLVMTQSSLSHSMMVLSKSNTTTAAAAVSPSAPAAICDLPA